MIEQHIIFDSDRWLEEAGPKMHVVISSRSRLARNLDNYRFALFARKEELHAVAEQIANAIQQIQELNQFLKIDLTQLDKIERHFLTESRIISKELEKSGDERFVYLSPDRRVSIMVNEEDHLRMQCILAGLQLRNTFEIINRIDDRLANYLDFAFSEKFGYLTACPTNVGTGLRLSVMLHLPALVIQNKIGEIVELIQPYGFILRGFQGENSEFEGDCYQVSNEITLGKTEEELLETLQKVVEQIIEREESARQTLFTEYRSTVDDVIWRSYALLRYARRLDSVEAMQLLSRIRLGIDLGYFPQLSHQQLNQLFIMI
ncbi:MAG: ATP--guanido phosphotransferase, partial [Candidatus Sumerlaeia bacterium]|nr:ATP--guanido phosphotransferase [Candidatus Sumerlaeia bacterium]